MQAPRQALTKSMAARNVRLLCALEFIERARESTPNELARYLEIDPSVARSMFRTLVGLELIVLTKAERRPNVKGNAAHYYRAAPNAHTTALATLSTEWKNAKLSHAEAKSLGRYDVDSKPLSKPVEVTARRDPLVAYLFGLGRAPSLNFMDSIQ